MELRQHSLFLSKRETVRPGLRHILSCVSPVQQGKDQVMLCSMNNFDAYVVIRNPKAPKGFVFAVKSTDNISYFESTTDYIHMFSVPEKDGVHWLESILLARVRTLHHDS